MITVLGVLVTATTGVLLVGPLAAVVGMLACRIIYPRFAATGTVAAAAVTAAFGGSTARPAAPRSPLRPPRSCAPLRQRHPLGATRPKPLPAGHTLQDWRLAPAGIPRHHQLRCRSPAAITRQPRSGTLERRHSPCGPIQLRLLAPGAPGRRTPCRVPGAATRCRPAP